MSSQQIKAFVSLRQFDQITQFDIVSDEQIVKAYQFTEELQSLSARLLANAAAGIGTQAIVAERGVGKSHLLNLIRSIANIPRLINLLEDPNAITTFQKIVLPKLPVDGFPTLTLGFDPDKGLNLVKAFPKVPELENLPPANLIAYVDEIIEQRLNTGVQIALFIDGISQFLLDPQQGEPLLQWLQELAKEAVNGKFSLMITLDQNIAEGPLKKILATIFKYEYLPANTIASITENKLFFKTPSQKRQIENLFTELCKKMPHFSEPTAKFVQLYPLHPTVLSLAPSLRSYARSFSLFGFLTAVSSRALLRRAFNLISLDELFDSFEFDLRKHQGLTEAFASYDYLFSYVPSMQQPHSMYAKMMLKALLLFSLSGKSVTAKELASSVMLYDDREPIAFVEILNSIMARLAATSSGLVVNADGPELSYKFHIPEHSSVAMLSSASKPTESASKPFDSNARTITKTGGLEKPQGINSFSAIIENPIKPPVSVREAINTSPLTTKQTATGAHPSVTTKEIPVLTREIPSLQSTSGISESPLQLKPNSAQEPNKTKSTKDSPNPEKPTATKLFPRVPPPPLLNQSPTQLPTHNSSIVSASPAPSGQISLDKLTIAVSQISDDDIRLDHLLITGGKKYFKDWPFTFEGNIFRDRAELNIKWYGSLRKGIIKFEGNTELYQDTDTKTPPCDIDWQITIFRSYAPMVLPPPPEAPSTLLHWQPISISGSERLVLKQLLVIIEGTTALGSEKEVNTLKTQLEDQLVSIFQKVYLKSRLLTNQHIDLYLSTDSPYLSINLTKLLDKLFAKRYPAHPAFEDLLTIETATDLIPWVFQSQTTPTPDQQAILEQFARPLDLIVFEETKYKISSPEKTIPVDSPTYQLWKALEQNQLLTKLQAFKIVHKEPFGLQKPALLLILALLAGGGHIVLLDEFNEPIHDNEGLRQDIELSDFSSIRLLQEDLKQVSWKTVKKMDDDSSSYQNTTLLIVDDDSTIHMVLKIAAQKLQCKIETAIDGVTALETLETLPVDLIISDLRMPNLTGIELFQHIQNNPKLKGVPFVVLSSIDDDEEVAAALEQGVEDYWIKPLRVNEIQARIKRLLKRRTNKNPDAKSSKIADEQFTPKSEPVLFSDNKLTNTSSSNSEISVPSNQKLLDTFHKQAEKEITILPSKADVELLKESLIASSSKSLNKDSFNSLETTDSKIGIPVIPHPPIPTRPTQATEKPIKDETAQSADKQENLQKHKSDKITQKSSKSINKPNEDGLIIPTRTDELPSISQFPQFEIKNEEEKPGTHNLSSSSPTSFNVNLSNSDGMLMEIMQLYNHFWDTCRRVGKPTSIPEYEEFKELVITKANKLKKQFHWDEITFIIVVEDDQAYVDCQINRVSNFLKTPPKFRVL